jgi:hypothetical protein
MPSADQVPVNSMHAPMHWPKWVVLIAASNRSALRAVRLPNLHITPMFRRDPFHATIVRRVPCGLPDWSGVDTFEEEANLAPYFERTATLGFANQRDYERDLNDPKWLER